MRSKPHISNHEERNGTSTATILVFGSGREHATKHDAGIAESSEQRGNLAKKEEENSDENAPQLPRVVQMHRPQHHAQDGNREGIYDER